MNPLHLLRRAVRTASWALAIGTVAAIVYSLLVISMAPVWPASDPLRAGLVAVLEAAVVFGLAWVFGLVIELSDRAGLCAGLWAQALPALVVLLVEGPLGLEPQLPLRIVGFGLSAAAGLLAARIGRRRGKPAPPAGFDEAQADRSGSGPPSTPTA